MKSWNTSKNIDCFGLGNPNNIDHIWPTSLGGSNNQKNKMRLSQSANSSMGNKTKGRIGNYRWSKVRAVTSDGIVYGRLRIRHDSVEDKNNWTFVTPVL